MKSHSQREWLLQLMQQLITGLAVHRSDSIVSIVACIVSLRRMEPELNATILYDAFHFQLPNFSRL